MTAISMCWSTVFLRIMIVKETKNNCQKCLNITRCHKLCIASVYWNRHIVNNIFEWNKKFKEIDLILNNDFYIYNNGYYL